MKLLLLTAISVLGVFSLFAVTMTGRLLSVGEINRRPAAVTNSGATIPGAMSSTETQTQPIAIAMSAVDLTGLPAEVTELAQSLLSLHRISVHAFESSPMFGYNRAGLQTELYSNFEYPVVHLPPIVEPLPGWRKKASVPVRETGDKDAIEGRAAWEWLYAMHGITSRGLVYREADLALEERNPNAESPADAERDTIAQFVVGLPSESGSLDFDTGYLKLDASPLEPSDRLWKLQFLQLISILKHDPPVAYEERRRNEGQNAGKVLTRNLEEIERTSLQRLRAGKDHVITWNADTKQVNMVAAIRAKHDCVKCHAGMKRDDLMGAFVYRLESPQGEH